MDNISNILQEAKPLYNKRKKQKRSVIRFGCITCLLFFTSMTIKIHDWHNSTDMLYSELYMNTSSYFGGHADYYIDEFDAIGII